MFRAYVSYAHAFPPCPPQEGSLAALHKAPERSGQGSGDKGPGKGQSEGSGGVGGGGGVAGGGGDVTAVDGKAAALWTYAARCGFGNIGAAAVLSLSAYGLGALADYQVTTVY